MFDPILPEPTIKPINNLHFKLKDLSKSDGFLNGFLVTNETGKLCRMDVIELAPNLFLSAEEKNANEIKLQRAIVNFIKKNISRVSSTEDIAMMRILFKRVGGLRDRNTENLINEKNQYIQVRDQAHSLIKKILSTMQPGKSDELRNELYDLITKSKGNVRQAFMELVQERKISAQDLNGVISKEMILNDTGLQAFYDDLSSQITLSVQKETVKIVNKIAKYAKVKNISKRENAQREFFLLSVGNEQNIAETLKELALKRVINENNLKYIIDPELIIMNPQFEKIHNEVSSEIMHAVELFKDQRLSLIRKIVSCIKDGNLNELKNAKYEFSYLIFGNEQHFTETLKELTWNREISVEDLKEIIDEALILRSETKEIYKEVLAEIQTVTSIIKILDAAKVNKSSELENAQKKFFINAVRNQHRLPQILKELAQRGVVASEVDLQQIIDLGLIKLKPEFQQIYNEALTMMATVVQKQADSVVDKILRYAKFNHAAQLKTAQEEFYHLIINNKQSCTQIVKELIRKKLINKENLQLIFQPEVIKKPEIKTLYKEVLSEIQTFSSITKILDAIKTNRNDLENKSNLEKAKNEFYSKIEKNEQRISSILKDLAQRGMITEADLKHVIDPKMIMSRLLFKEIEQKGMMIKEDDLKESIDSRLTILKKQFQQIYLEVMSEIALTVKKQTVPIVNEILNQANARNTDELGKAQKEFFLLTFGNEQSITQALKELALKGVVNEDNLKHIIQPEMMIMRPQFEQLYQEVLAGR